MLMKHMDAKHKIDVEKRKATHSGILAWEIPWMEEPEKITAYGITKELEMTEQLNDNSDALKSW